MSETPGHAARHRAADVIDGILRRNEPFEDSTLDGLEPRDRGFTHALIGLALRHKGEIDAVITQFLTKPLPKSSGLTQAILITATAQLLFMRVPPHAAIDQAVGMARDDRNARHFSGLVNAVLRKIAQHGPGMLSSLDAPRLNTPSWLWRRWSKTFGEAQARRIAESHLTEPALDITMKPGAAKPPGMLLPSCTLRLDGHVGRIEDIAGYADGDWWVQDVAAALPAKLLGDVRGKSILDLCAAPGGKTAQLAAAGANVTAVDMSASRLERLAANLARLKLSAHLIQSDVLDFRPAERFDAILLDAPCSATGTIRRHPDLPWIKSEKQIADLATLQGRMLAQAAQLLRPGGRFVYCTCSLEAEEGESRIAKFLRQNQSFERLPISPDEIGGLNQAVTASGDLRTLPFFSTGDATGMDGFFAARLRLTEGR